MNVSQKKTNQAATMTLRETTEMKCAICNEPFAPHGRRSHMKLFHAVLQVVDNAKRFRPKAIVVAEWEESNARYLILPNGQLSIEREPAKPEMSPAACPEGCTCSTCFNTALDRLVASTEEAANDARISLDINDVMESDQLQVRSTTDGLDTVQHFDGR